MKTNMLLPLEFKDNIIAFSNINVEFHTEHKKFRINNLWLDEIDEEFFHKTINEFVEGLKTILIDNFVLTISEDNNNNLLIVDELLTILHHKISWYNTNKIESYSSFSNFNGVFNSVDYPIDYDVIEYYTIDKVLNYDFNQGIEEEKIIYCLFAHKDSTKQYKNSLDFEKVKLFFFLSRYFIDHKLPENKCNIKLDKISSAFLFKLLIEADLIYMDADEGRNESKIKKFAETYFNYTDSNREIKPLTDFTKEYSKLKGASKKNNQLKVLEILSRYIAKKTTFLN